MAQELSVGIIGGGYAGMAAAVELAARGIPVTVYEGAKQVGGRARGVQHNGLQLDNGQHILLGCYRETLRLIELVGGNIGQDFLHLPLQLTLHNRFELKAASLPSPLHLLGGLLAARGLTFAQKRSAIRFMLTMRRMNFALPFDMAAIDFLMRQEQDEQLIHVLWEPICIAALNTPLHMASAQVLLNVLRDSFSGSRQDSEMLLPRMDFSALFPNRAAEYVEQHGGKVFTSCTVDAILPQDGNIELLTAQDKQRFSHVICAASPASATRLLRDLPQLARAATQIESLEFQPIYTVYLQYPQQVRLLQPMLGFHGCFTQWLFDRGRISGQEGLLAAVISAEGAHQKLEHEQLAQRVVQELENELGITAMPLWHQVIAEKRATFACEPNLDRPPQHTPMPNVFLAGDYTAGDYPATLEGAVMSGVKCAYLIPKW